MGFHCEQEPLLDHHLNDKLLAFFCRRQLSPELQKNQPPQHSKEGEKVRKLKCCYVYYVLGLPAKFSMPRTL